MQKNLVSFHVEIPLYLNGGLKVEGELRDASSFEMHKVPIPTSSSLSKIVGTLAAYSVPVGWITYENSHCFFKNYTKLPHQLKP